MSTAEVAKVLVIRFGIQPSEIARLTVQFICELLDNSDEIVTLADTAALHRFMGTK